MEITHHQNGRIKSSLNYKESKSEGIKTYWDEKGKKIGQAVYKKGSIISGLEVSWHVDNNHKEKEVNYENGKKKGKETFWYENGQIKTEVNYENGKKKGKRNLLV